MRTDYQKLKAKINSVYYGCKEKYPTGDSIDSALKIYKKIKEFERFPNNSLSVDYENELREAKFDLVDIFGMKPEELKTLSKNNLYLTHQSKLVNAIYIMNKGEY